MNIVVGTVLGILSGKYIFEEPLQRYWHDAEKQRLAADVAAGSSSSSSSSSSGGYGGGGLASTTTTTTTTTDATRRKMSCFVSGITLNGGT